MKWRFHRSTEQHLTQARVHMDLQMSRACLDPHLVRATAPPLDREAHPLTTMTAKGRVPSEIRPVRPSCSRNGSWAWPWAAVTILFEAS
jgi:hypothetical protein